MAAVPSGGQIYTLTISVPPNIQTCNSAAFSYSVNPTLSTLQPVDLVVSIQTADGSLSQILNNSAQLGEGSWLWNPVNVQAGQYRLAISSANDQQYTIDGLSNPFIIRLGSTSCLGVPNPTQQPSPSPSPSPSSSSPGSSLPSQSNVSNTSKSSTPSPHSSSSSSSSTTGPPTNISAVSHSSVGLRAGVSVAVIAVVLAGAGALYWLLASRRRRNQRPIRKFGGYDPGYDGLTSRDDYPSEPKHDPLGRSLSSGQPAGGAVSSYSRSDLIDEKSAVGGTSSNGATAGHSGGVDSFTALGYLPPAVPPPLHKNVMGERNPSGSSYESGSTLEDKDFETTTVASTVGVQQPRRAVRKPVPAYSESRARRDSKDRKHRDSANSINTPSYSSSLVDVPPQPSQPAPGHSTTTLNHKGSFGEKPMNHILMPDLPLPQN